MASVGRYMIGTVVSASPDEGLSRVAARMEDMHIGGLPVIDDQGELVGIVTSRDVRRAHHNRLVADVMTTPVVTVAPESSVWEALELLEKKAIERLPVVSKGQLVGIITKGVLQEVIGRMTDDLTGLPRTSYLRYKAHQYLSAGVEVCLVFVDINDFGAINKRLGHAVGDECLVLVSRVLASYFGNDHDHLCRFGGDEFAILTTRQSEEVRQQARTMVAAVKSVFEQQNTPVTIAVGITGGRRRAVRAYDPETTVQNLINIASRASTEAKRGSLDVVLVEVPGA